MRITARSCALTGQHFTVANISRSGPLVQVAPHRNLGVIIDSRKPIFNGLNLLSRPAWEYRRISECVWKYLKASEITWKQKRFSCSACVFLAVVAVELNWTNHPHTVDKSLLTQDFVRRKWYGNLCWTIPIKKSALMRISVKEKMPCRVLFLERNANDVLHERLLITNIETSCWTVQNVERSSALVCLIWNCALSLTWNLV